MGFCIYLHTKRQRLFLYFFQHFSMWHDFDCVMTLGRGTIFDTNCSNQTLMVLKYLNCLHELCVTRTAAAVTAACVDKRAKSEHLHAPVTFTSPSIFPSRLSFRAPPRNSSMPPRGGFLHSFKSTGGSQVMQHNEQQSQHREKDVRVDKLLTHRALLFLFCVKPKVSGEKRRYVFN